MVDNSRLRMVFHISGTEFHRWMRSSRIIILGVMLVFVHMQVITPLQECAQMMGEPVSMLEAFIALGNSGTIVLVIPALFLVLIADFPLKGGIDRFYQIRCSKRVWVFGQALFAVEAAIFVVLFLLVGSAVMIFGSGKWSLQFSHAVTHYTTVFPERYGDYLTQLLPENIYQQMSLGTALRHTLIFMFLYFVILAMILLLASVCGKKNAGILLDGFLIILGTITCAVNMGWMWLFPMAHTISWIHYGKYLSKELFPITGSYIYLFGLAIGLFAGCVILARKYQAEKG